MKTPATFYMRQLDQVAFAFSIATGLIMTAGVLAMLVLFPPSPHRTQSAGGDVVVMQTIQTAPAD